MSQTKQDSFVGVDDAEYILEPVAKQLLAAGVSHRGIKTTLRAAARRVLRLAASDRGLSLSLGDTHASSVVRRLVG